MTLQPHFSDDEAFSMSDAASKLVDLTKRVEDVREVLAASGSSADPDRLTNSSTEVDAIAMTVVNSFGSLGSHAFDKYYRAIDRVIDGKNAFGASSARAAQAAFSQMMKNLGMQAAGLAAYEFGLAAASSAGFLGALALGSPTQHLKAGALFASVATAAGVGSAATSTKSHRSRESKGSPGKSGPKYRVTIIGALDDQGARDLIGRLHEKQAVG